MLSLRRYLLLFVLWALVFLPLPEGGRKARTSQYLAQRRRRDARVGGPPPGFSPQPPPTEAEASAALASLPCAAPPASWPPPTRVHQPRFTVSPSSPLANWTDEAILLYSDVLVAEDAACARLTRARSRTPALPGDSDRMVLATHLDVSRLPHLLRLSQRWEGCLSVAIRLCAGEEWAQLLQWRANHSALRLPITFHAAVSHGLYPNALRNAPLEPFAPWAAAAPLPAPWVLVVDVDGLPSVNAPTLEAWVRAAAEGALHALPTTLPGARPLVDLPPYLRPHMLDPNHTLGLGLPPGGPLFSPLPPPTPQQCARHAQRPLPLQCSPLGLPTALGWALDANTSAWAAQMSHCPPPTHPAALDQQPQPQQPQQQQQQDTLFVLPSFDVQYYKVSPTANWSDPTDHNHVSAAWNRALYNASLGALLGIPGSAPPSHAHYLLRSLAEPWLSDVSHPWLLPGDGEPLVAVQAVNAFTPSYHGLIPWRAWLAEDTGVLPVHYSLGFEPYFIARAPLPSSSAPPLWGVFDEAFRNTWFDKCLFFFATAGRGTHRLSVLPQVFWLNDHELESADTAPKSPLDQHRKASSWRRLEAALEGEDLVCRSMCPCVKRELVEVIPEQGFLIS